MCILDILSPLVQRTTHQRNKSFQNINRGQYIIEIINICCTGYNLMTKNMFNHQTCFKICANWKYQMTSII